MQVHHKMKLIRKTLDIKKPVVKQLVFISTYLINYSFRFITSSKDRPCFSIISLSFLNAST